MSNPKKKPKPVVTVQGVMLVRGEDSEWHAVTVAMPRDEVDRWAQDRSAGDSLGMAKRRAENIIHRVNRE